MNMKLITFIIITIIPLTSYAKIFKCKKGGKAKYKTKISILQKSLERLIDEQVL